CVPAHRRVYTRCVSEQGNDGGGPDEGHAETVEARPPRTSGARSGAGAHSADATLPASAGRAGAAVPEVDPQNYVGGAEVGGGGLGRTVRARDRRLDRPVAIKELLHAQSEAASRFAREALLTARLQHPAIVPVYEAGIWPNGAPFYAMKLVSGRSLEA